MLRLFAPLLLALPALAQTTVHLVDPAGGPGVDFTDLQVAIDTVADGDVLLLASGDYTVSPFGGGQYVIDGKGLTLVADAGASVTSSAFVITNLAASQHLTLRGVTFADGGSLLLVANAGVVWVEDCHFSLNLNGSASAVTADGCEALILDRCTATCDQVVAPPGISWGRIAATSSNVALYDCSIAGCDANPFAPTAMTGMVMTDGTAFIVGTDLLGGDGCGGSGLALKGLDPFAQIVDSNVLAGMCSSTTPDIDVQAGSYQLLRDAARYYHASGPVHSGGTLTLEFQGTPNDFFWLDLGNAPGYWNTPWSTGVWQIALPSYLNTIFLGNLSAGGTATLNVPVGALTGPVQLWTQADMMDVTTFQLTLAGGSYVLLLP